MSTQKLSYIEELEAQKTEEVAKAKEQLRAQLLCIDREIAIRKMLPEWAINTRLIVYKHKPPYTGEAGFSFSNGFDEATRNLWTLPHILEMAELFPSEPALLVKQEPYSASIFSKEVFENLNEEELAKLKVEWVKIIAPVFIEVSGGISHRSHNVSWLTRFDDGIREVSFDISPDSIGAGHFNIQTGSRIGETFVTTSRYIFSKVAETLVYEQWSAKGETKSSGRGSNQSAYPTTAYWVPDDESNPGTAIDVFKALSRKLPTS